VLVGAGFGFFAVVEVPVDRGPQSVFERGARFEAEQLLRSARVDPAARLTVGL
jgi:hypothetical protein